jgi:competence protein ComGC
MEQPPPLPTGLPQSKTSALAVWSMVLGVLSVTCFWLITGIPAVICGHMAYSRIKRSAGALEGQGLALGGLITGYVSIAISLLILPLLLAIAVPNFVKARATAQMNACLSNLRQIEGAKEQWALDNKKTANDTPTAQELQPYLKMQLTCPAGGVYTFNPVGQSPTCSIPTHTRTSE